MDNQPLAIRITSTKSKAAHIPTPAELKQQTNEDEWQLEGGPAQPPTRFIELGTTSRQAGSCSKLAIQIRRAGRPIRSWGDGETDLLGILKTVSARMVALKAGAALARFQRAKEAEEARLEKEEQELQRAERKRCREALVAVMSSPG